MKDSAEYSKKSEINVQSIFERNPKKSIAFFLVFSIAFIDIFSGLFFIPERHAEFREPHAYYHHGLRPNRESYDTWFDVRYPFVTNSLGFRDGAARQVALSADTERIVLIGDSFIEGQGVAYETSVAGRLQQLFSDRGIDVLNAAAVSYCPKLYYLKTRYLIETVGLEFDRLVVFIDISDVQNEIIYRNFRPTEISRATVLRYRVDKLLRRVSFFYFALTGGVKRDTVVPDFGTRIFENPFNEFEDEFREIVERSYDFEYLASWTYSRRHFEEYGEYGLRLARKNMTSLFVLCSENEVDLTVVIYPWPQQVRHGDVDNIHVNSWKGFCAENGVQLIDLFPLFIDERRAGRDVRGAYFIPSDVHWNAEGCDKVAQAVFSVLADAASSTPSADTLFDHRGVARP